MTELKVSDVGFQGFRGLGFGASGFIGDRVLKDEHANPGKSSS